MLERKGNTEPRACRFNHSLELDNDFLKMRVLAAPEFDVTRARKRFIEVHFGDLSLNETIWRVSWRFSGVFLPEMNLVQHTTAHTF